MAKATFVKSARKDIYRHGKAVEYVSQRGKKEGQTLRKIDRTLPRDENDEVIIKAGESYYHWAFNFGPKCYSKEKPKQSQLTQNPFLQSIYGIQEMVDEISTQQIIEDAEGVIDSIKEPIQELLDEFEEKASNMECANLENVPSYEIVTERRDRLQEMIDELEYIDVSDKPEIQSEDDFDRDEIRKELIDMYEPDESLEHGEGGEPKEEHEPSDDMIEEHIASKIAEQEEELENWAEEKLDEITNVDYTV